jgi:hypothetical protein
LNQEREQFKKKDHQPNSYQILSWFQIFLGAKTGLQNSDGIWLKPLQRCRIIDSTLAIIKRPLMHSTTEMKGLSRNGQPATPRLVPPPLELPNTGERVPKKVDSGDCDESRPDVPSLCSYSPSGSEVSSVHLKEPSIDEPNQTRDANRA